MAADGTLTLASAEKKNTTLYVTGIVYGSDKAFKSFGTTTVKVADITPPTITTTTLPNGEVGKSYSQTLAASGTAPITWSVASGTLPAGLTLSSAGKLSGTPTTAATSTFTVQATNSGGSDTQELSITVDTKAVTVVLTPKTVTVKKSNNQKFTVESGNDSVTWTVDSTLSSISQSGLLKVSFKETASTLTVTATSKVDTGISDTATVTVANAPKICTVTFDSQGGTPTPSAISGIEEDSTISLPSAPSKLGFDFVGWFTAATNGTAFTNTSKVTTSITLYAQWTKRSVTGPAITTTSLPNGTVGTAYSQTLTAIGSTPMEWSITTGSLPAGLTLNTTTGVISGTPTASGTMNFTVQVDNGEKATKDLSIVIDSPITAFSISPANPTVQKTKTQQFTATVEPAASAAVTWSLTGGTNSTIDTNGLLTVGAMETATSLTVKAVSKVDSSKSDTTTVTVQALTYSITFNSDGGSLVNTMSSIPAGTTVTLPAKPTKTGFRFEGWFTAQNGSGTEFTATSKVIDNITLYAKWTAVFTIAGTVQDSDGNFVSGATVTVSPVAGTSAVTSDSNGAFRLEVPAGTYDVTAVYPDKSSETVKKVTASNENVAIRQIKLRITFNEQPQDAVIVKGLTNTEIGGSVTIRTEAARVPHIQDALQYTWYQPAGQNPDLSENTKDTLISVSGYIGGDLTIKQDDARLPARGEYRLYSKVVDTSNPPAATLSSRVATLRVIGVNTIQGTVTKDGQPVNGAGVRLEQVSSLAPAGTKMTSSTNPQTTPADGTYKFETVPDGKYTLVITLPNGGGTIVVGPYDFPKTPPTDIDITIPSAPMLTVTSQPKDQRVKKGATAEALTTKAVINTADTVVYQWYSNTTKSSNQATKIVGATSETYIPPATNKGITYYYCVASAGALTATTTIAKVDVWANMTIKGTILNENDKKPIAEAIVKLISKDDPVNDPITDSTNPQTTSADGKYLFAEVPEGKYEIEVTLPGGNIIIIPLDLPKDLPVEPEELPIVVPSQPTISIQQQPKDKIVALHDTANFTIGATVAPSSDSLRYQWYQNTKNSTTGGTKIEDATNASYIAPTATSGTQYYYCEVTATGATKMTSNVAKLTVRNSLYMTIAGEVKDEQHKGIEGAIVTLTPAAGSSINPQTTGADGAYKFERLPIRDYVITVKLPGGGILEVPVKPGDPDDPKFDPEIDPGIVVEAKNAITIHTQPKAVNMTADMSALFRIKATASKSSTLTYQWYRNTTNASTGGTAINNATTDTLSLTQQTVGESWYYCEVKSPDATTQKSDAAKLTVSKAPEENGALEGEITDDESGKPVADVAVKLMKNGTDGTQFGSTVYTDQNGKFTFTAIPYASYSLVASKDAQIITKQIGVKAKESTENLILPSGGKTTKVEVLNDTPSTAAENLDELFTDDDNGISERVGATVEIKLVVEKKDSPADKATIDTAAEAAGKTVGLYLDAQLIRTITGTAAENGSENIQPPTGQTVRIVLDLPVALQDNKDYKIIRSHNGTVKTIEDLVYDETLQTLSFNADVFSTYAVVFDQVTKYEVTVKDGGTGSSGSGPYVAGKNVTINAGNKDGQSFTGWTVTSGDVSLDDASSASTSFIMPASDVTVTANWKTTDPAVTKYLVSIVGGGIGSSGGGTYVAGKNVTINAGSREGQSFTGWTVTSGGDVRLDDKSSASTSFIMPASAVTVTANWKTTDPAVTKYLVSIVDGGIGFSGGGTHAAGQSVTINAGSKDGQSFTGWTVTSGGVSLDNASSASTSFTMPANDVTVTAHWSDGNHGGGNNGGGNHGDSTKPDQPPKITPPEHGTVTIAPTVPKAGETVTITPKPDDGYQTKDVLVLDNNGKTIAVTDNGDGTWSYTQPGKNVSISVSFEKKPSTLPFTDVNPSDWFYDSVKNVYDKGWMTGSTTTTFSPYLSTSRGMITTILWRMENNPTAKGVNPFNDVETSFYYAKAIDWGAENKIIKGYGDGNFGPNDPITREQLAAILHRYAQFKGLKTTESGDLSKFTDQPSAWATENVRWAIGTGILAGKGNGLLDPLGQATRAETATMLTQFAESQRLK